MNTLPAPVSGILQGNHGGLPGGLVPMETAAYALCRLRFVAFCTLAWIAAGCGGGSGFVTAQRISVNLPVETVTIKQNGAPVTIPIEIQSTSETALVNIVGLPAGVSETYAASDTNPSGTLTFSATRTATTGRFMPQISVMSAGGTATAVFTLVVQMS